MIHREVLDNGLRVLVRPTTSAPLAAIYLWIDAGSVDEQPNEQGAAHFLEHMIFKGTPKRGIGAAAAEIEGLGGDLNAYTSWDQTVVHATVEASAWREALDVVVDMVRGAIVDPAEFDKEKQVILEEIRGYLAEPESVIGDETVARLYPGHGYGRPIVGTVATIEAMGRDDLLGFRRRCYEPRRIVLSIAGDVDATEVLAMARGLLADWAPGAGRLDNPAPTEALAGPLRLSRDFDTTAVELAWRMPPLGHPDIPALDVLAAALGDGASSTLPLRLQIRDGVATDVGATLSLHAGGGDLSIGFLPREAQTAEAIKAALDEVGRVLRTGISGGQLAKARASCLADFLFGEETVDGLAHDAAWYTARHGDPAVREAYRASLATVTADDVRRVAREWLIPDRAVVVALDKALRDKKLVEAAKIATVARRPTSARSGPRKTVFDNGATLWVVPDDTPVSAVRIAALGGGLAVDARRAGAHGMWARGITAGAGDLDVEHFSSALDDIAGTLDGLAGRNLIGISATFPADHTEVGLGLVGAALADPWFDEGEVDRLRDELVEEVRTADDRPAEVAGNVLWAALWPGHPWRLPQSGTEASLDRVSAGVLRAWHKRLVTADNVVACVAGGVDPDAVADAFGPWLEKLPAGPFGLEARDPAGPAKAGLHHRRAGREQAWVLVGARSAGLHDPARIPEQIAAAILGGQGGRLFLSLREARGLAYSVWARASSGWDGGTFTAGLATEPKRVEEARDALLAELGRLVTEPPTREELDRNRRMLVGQAAMGFQRAAGRASDVALGERLGLPTGLAAFREMLAAVTLDDVRDAYAAVWRQEPVVVVVEPET